MKIEKPYTENWLSIADNMLIRGFGVEDVAVKLGCSPDKVRAYVDVLRKIGRLKQWWPPHA